MKKIGYGICELEVTGLETPVVDFALTKEAIAGRKRLGVFKLCKDNESFAGDGDLLAALISSVVREEDEG